MTTYQRYKTSVLGKSSVIKKSHADTLKLPDQLSEYMQGSETRFEEICRIYLDGLTLDDLQFLNPDDLICLVPQEQHQHKLLMTIFAKRYLYGPDCAFNCVDPDVVENSHDACDCSDHHH